MHSHPLWLRLIHWLSFYVLAVMVWSGAMIYWAYPNYALRVGQVDIPLVPGPFLASLGLNFQLAKGLYHHFLFLWPFLALGLGYFLFFFLSGRWRSVFPDAADWQIVKGGEVRKWVLPAKGRYNFIQKLAYCTTLLSLVGLGFSGLVLWKPVRLQILTDLIGGYANARLLHFSCTLYLVFFFVVHVVQVIRAGWKTFSSMVTGGES